MSPRLRTSVVAVLGLAAIAWAADRVANSPSLVNPRDFLEYWAAGAVNVRGGNPYDPAELLRVQQLADPSRDGAVMMWNPPWSLAIYMPLGLLAPRWATLVWIGLQLVAALAACDLLWRTYGGSNRTRWVAGLIGATFAPVGWLVLWGQNTGLVLLGLAGFAYFHKLDRPALAGACAALTALKPHLLAVFGLLLVVDAVSRRGRVALASGAAVLVAALGAALVANPDVLAQYRQAVRDPGPGADSLESWILPVASYWLRIALDAAFWVQFVPCVAAGLAFAVYRLWQGRRWNWLDELPLVVWVSVLATPYGGWIFDLTVLLVPVVPIAVRLVAARRWRLAALLFAGHLGITAVSLAWSFSFPDFFWVAPAVLLLCLAAKWVTRKPR